MALLATVLTLALPIHGPVCHPDLITQLPMVCEQTVHSPFVSTYPVGPTGVVSFSAQYGKKEHVLRPWSEWGCVRLLRYRGMLGLVSRCEALGIRVALFQIDRAKPRPVHVTAAGGLP